MFLALITPGTPKYWMPFLSKMVAPALNQGMCFVPSKSSGTMMPVLMHTSVSSCCRYLHFCDAA